MKYIIVAFIIVAVIVIYAANRASGETLGFDYYLLSMSWSPEFCDTHSNSEECSKPRGFILHGLWPQYEDGGYPDNCGSGHISEDVIEDMMDVMPNRHLIIHEWRTHGSCSGMAPATYFKTAKNIFNSIAIPEFFTTLKSSYSTNPEGVINVFISENPGLSADAMQVVCHGNRFAEVRFCVDKQGKSRACGDIHDACHAGHLDVASPIQGE